MKKILMIGYLLVCVGFVFGQKALPEKNEEKLITRHLVLGLGGVYSSFQDVKFSDVQYSGTGLGLDIAYGRSTNKYFWEASFDLKYANENAATHSQAKTYVLNPVISAKYLRAIKDKLYLGAKIDFFDFYFRRTASLGNNGVYYTNNNHLYASLLYKYKLNDAWNMTAACDLALFGFVKESTSFGFSAPQQILEDGDYSYQDQSIDNPLSYKYSAFKFMWQNLSLKTDFMFRYKKRLELGYRWSVARFANVKSYPVTQAYHNVVFRFYMINKTK